MTAGTPSLTAGSLHLQFDRRGDRHGHTVYIVLPSGEQRPLLKSVEGDDSTDWPASPPLQNLHIEQRESGVTVALAVGMAGRSHWSLAVEALPEGELRFDAACRLSEAPTWLGSRYALGHDVQAANVEPPLELAVATAHRVMLQVGAAATVEALSTVVDGSNLNTQANEINVQANDGPQAWPATIRWQYSIRLATRS